MRPIPQKLRNELENDIFYKRCCVTGEPIGKVHIEWHHNFIFANKQVNERWCILPLWDEVHKIEKTKKVKERLNWIMLNRATDKELEKYSRVIDLKWERDRLNKQFGIWQNSKHYIPYGELT